MLRSKQSEDKQSWVNETVGSQMMCLLSKCINIKAELTEATAALPAFPPSLLIFFHPLLGLSFLLLIPSLRQSPPVLPSSTFTSCLLFPSTSCHSFALVWFSNFLFHGLYCSLSPLLIFSWKQMKHRHESLGNPTQIKCCVISQLSSFVAPHPVSVMCSPLVWVFV